MTITSRDYGRYEVWAPHATRCDLVLASGRTAMDRDDDGWFRLPGVDARSGTDYGFALDGGDPLPDPRSLWQPAGVHGLSRVHDPRTQTGATGWTGRDLRGAVLYELHIGTFTAEGTFEAAAAKLDHLVALGIDAVEVQPVAAFPGDRGWGYEGVALYATQDSYGGPAAFHDFITACHDRGLAVILDVVYNHLGPSGNYLAQFGPYFTSAHETPWGEAVNVDQPGSAEVRTFLLGNARQWLVDFGLDGLRLDAVHEIVDDSPTHLLAELATGVAAWERETGRPLTLIAESDRNQPATVSPVGTVPGARGMDLQWADDVHHALHSFLTGERQGYYVDFGDVDTLAHALSRVFVHDGGHSTFRDRPWGAPVDPSSELYDGHSFVAFLQNHDQIGNRARGDRLHHGLDSALHAIGAGLLLTSALTPMLFMGEEWAASTPWQFFTDHDAELGALVSAGRAEEFRHMGWDGEVPDPQADSTHRDSVLVWAEREHEGHARMLAWYRDLIALRRAEPDLRSADLAAVRPARLSDDALAVRRGRIIVVANRAEDPVHVDAGVSPLLGEDTGRWQDYEVALTFADAAAASDGALSVPGRSVTVLRRR